MKFGSKLWIPLRFLFFHGADWRIKAYYYAIPVAVGLVAAAAALALPGFSVFGDGGVIESIGGLTRMLVGFYFAALGLVSSLDRPALDKLLEEPELRERAPRTGALQRITRRRYLSAMFGYLAYMSVVIYLLGMAASALRPWCLSVAPSWLLVPVRVVFVLGYGGLFANVVVISVMALSYMSERIHRFEPTVTGPKDEDTDPGNKQR